MELPMLLPVWKSALILCIILNVCEVRGNGAAPCNGECGPGTRCAQSGMCECDTGYHRISLAVHPDSVVAYCHQNCDSSGTGCSANTMCHRHRSTGTHSCACAEGFVRASSGHCMEMPDITTTAITESTTNEVSVETPAPRTNATAGNDGPAVDVAGIVIGVIVAVLAIAVVVVIIIIFMRKRNKQEYKTNGNGLTAPENDISEDDSSKGEANPNFDNNSTETEMWNPGTYSIVPMHIVSSFKPESQPSTDENPSSKNGTASGNSNSGFDLTVPSNVTESQT